MGSIVCHRNVRIVVLGYPAAKIQTQAGAFCFARCFASDPVKAGEYFILFLIRDARPFVGDLQLYQGF